MAHQIHLAPPQKQELPPGVGNDAELDGPDRRRAPAVAVERLEHRVTFLRPAADAIGTRADGIPACAAGRHADRDASQAIR
jgi:hypothetical protein